MESFNRGEHEIVALIDVEKAFDNVWHNGFRYKIYQLDLPTKLCRRFYHFLVGRVIQVKSRHSTRFKPESITFSYLCLPYVRERLITVCQNNLARMHATPPVEHTINSARTNIAWYKYKPPNLYLNHHTDLLTPTTGCRKMGQHLSTSNH